MDKVDFKDFYIEDVLREIKHDVRQNIDLEPIEVQDISGDREEIADQKMREILKDILINSKDNPDAQLRYNFLLLRNTNDEKSKMKLRCCLVLYYTAIYYGKVELLQKLISKDVNFGDDTISLSLYLLDPVIADMLPTDDYIELIKNARQALATIYNSVRQAPVDKKKEYLKKFEVTAKRKNNFISKLSSSAWLTGVLDIYDEKTYLKASVSQINTIMVNNTHFTKDENVSKINELLQDTYFSVGRYSFYHMDEILSAFSVYELGTMTDNTILYVVDAANAGADLKRIRLLIEKRPSITNYYITCFKEFLNTFDDEEILQMSKDVLIELQTKKSTYFPSNFGKKEKAKVRKLVGVGRVKLF